MKDLKYVDHPLLFSDWQSWNVMTSCISLVIFLECSMRDILRKTATFLPLPFGFTIRKYCVLVEHSFHFPCSPSRTQGLSIFSWVVFLRAEVWPLNRRLGKASKQREDLENGVIANPPDRLGQTSCVCVCVCYSKSI